MPPPLVLFRSVLQHKVADKNGNGRDNKRQHQPERGRLAVVLFQCGTRKSAILHHVEQVVAYCLVLTVGVETVESKQVSLIGSHPCKEDD